MKTCTKCGRELPFTLFYRAKHAKDGRRSDCKECSAAASRERRLRNIEVVKAKRKKAYAQNRERSLEYSKAYRAKQDPEILRMKQREYEASRRERRVEYRAARREHRKAYDKMWRELNPEKCRVQGSKYRAKKRSAEGHYSDLDWRLIKSYRWKNFCLLCLKHESSETQITVDHVVALKNGGSNWPANLAPLCHSCNSGKCDKVVPDYREDFLDRLYASQLARGEEASFKQKGPDLFRPSPLSRVNSNSHQSIDD